MAADLIYRRRLINQINTPAHHIVYIFGPAGFGKTILARHWMESQTLPNVWVEGFSTSNAAELFQVFLREITKQLPHLETPLAKLRDKSSVTFEDILEFSKVIEQDKTPFNVVIDNAEEIRVVHNDLSMAIVRYMPRHVKLVLVTSTSPSSRFVSDAGLNRFEVITPDQLKFNQEEIRQLFQEATKEINDSDIALIEELTEGWPASTGIVTSLLRNNPSFKEELSSLRIKGKQQFSIEANRVLARIDASQRDMLRQLSPLQRIKPEIAFEITKNIDVIRQLTLLSQDTIIVSQIEQVPPAFKIHPIFRDALIDQLRRDSSFNGLVETVIQALLDQNEVRQSTEILIEMGETTKLNDILRDEQLLTSIGFSIQDSVTRSAVNELNDWLPVAEHMPAVGALGKAVINFYIELLKGDFKAAEAEIRILSYALDSIDKEVKQSWEANLLSLKSIMAFANGRLEENWSFAVQAIEARQKLPNGQDRNQLLFLQLALWGAVMMDNDARINQIIHWLDSIGSKDLSAGRSVQVIAMRCLIAAHHGRLLEAQNHLIMPISMLTQSKLEGFFGPFGTRLAEAIVSGEAGNFARSMDLLKSNVEEATSAKNFPIAIASLGRLAYQLALQRRSEEGLACIESARALIVDNYLSEELNSVVDMWEIRVRHFMLDNDRVQNLLKRCQPSYFLNSFQAAASISQGNLELTKEIIQTFDLSIPRQAITYYLFRAHLYKDSPGQQLKEIVQAVEVGSKHGYFYHFVTQRSDILQQYISLASENPTAFNERLARAAGIELNKMMTAKGETGESLTRREADILRHLATGLPIKDIARNLSISKNTIKTHLRNLYRKLGAIDRDDAVAKGKKLLKI